MQHIRFDNSYTRLPERFYVRQQPVPVREPGLIAVNEPFARHLGLKPEGLTTPEVIQALAGNAVLQGSMPLAQAYAGHQFGGWVPQLGDGRALLLGEIVTPEGKRYDIALKGSGPTPFSRRGDGRAWVGPVIREYVVSEAMHALGVPTTRSLAAVTTGETVMREGPYPGAVLTRVAASHLRVGTFQYFAAREDIEALQLLTDYAIARHYPDSTSVTAFFDSVIAAQARLIAQWMSLGFVHGVMNTDNMTISGETIDYGPCAFLDGYDPAKVFSSIDHHGRYAFGNQPKVAQWNLAQLGSCLIPLFESHTVAIDTLTASLERFAPLYQTARLDFFRAKIGITGPDPADAELIDSLLAHMADERADFTRTFHGLATGHARAEFANTAGFDHWEQRWKERIAGEPAPLSVMRKSNPVYIPRNHRVEQVIAAAVQGDYEPFARLNAVLSRPYDEQLSCDAYTQPPSPDEEVTRTFCGT